MPSGLPVVLTVDPVAQRWRGRPVHVQVINDGTVPIRVDAQSVTLGKTCTMIREPAVTITPGAFTLAPGHWVLTTVTAPAATGDYGALFSATTLTRGGIHLGTSVGSQILSGTAKNCVPVRALGPDHTITPDLWCLIGVLIAVITALVLARRWGWFRHVR